MAQIDDVINSLTPDELDTLNSDPEMLKAFKTKYLNPPIPSNNTNSMVGIAKSAISAALPSPSSFNPISPEGPNPASMGISAALQTLRDPTRISPTLSQPGQVAAESQTGQAIEQAAQNVGIPKAASKFAIQTALDPQSYLGIGLTPEAGGIEGELGSFAEDLKQDSSLARFNKKLLGISESATKMGGPSLPTPSTEDINSAVDNVIKAHQDVVNSFGQDLNKAKTNAGLPVSEAEKSDSIRLYGNKRNLNIGQPLEMSPDAPKTVNPGDTISVSGNNLPDQTLTYRGPMAQDSPEALKNLGVSDDLINKMKQPFYDLSTDIPGHPAKSSLSEEALKAAGYNLPDISKGSLGYKITPTTNSEGLNGEVGRFLNNLDYISKNDQIKAASYFQDRIKSYIPDFSQEGNETQGLLKSKYQQLKDVINNASPELQQAKSNFAQMKQSLDLVSDKLAPDQPGKTQDFLRRVFTSNTQAANDTRQQLASLEQLSGQPVISDLFKKFAGQEFGQFVGPTGERLVKKSLPYAIGGTLFGHGLASLGGLGIEAAATSPKLIGGLESIVPKSIQAAPIAAEVGQKGLQYPFRTPQLQSLKDRLSNSVSFKDSKYANK